MPIHLSSISRRRFVKGAIALPALAVGRHGWAADKPSDPHTWAILADTHIAPVASYRERDKPTQARATQLVPHLRAVSRGVLSLNPGPAGLILNGDCVDFGTVEDYELLLGSVADLTKPGIPLHMTLGNHDHRQHFMEQVRTSLRLGVKAELPDRLVSVIPAGRANWFLLDSLMMEDANRGGMLGKEQLSWLAKALDDHADRPAIVVAHHNIRPNEALRKKSETIVRSVAPMIKLDGGLMDTDEFLDILFTRRHVKACFCGHKHQLSVHRLNGIFFVFQPAVGYPFHPDDAAGWLRVRLLDGGAELLMNSIDPKHGHHLKKCKLEWS
jgi:Icc protein